MKSKIKEIVNMTLIVLAVVFLGFAPATEKALALKWGDLSMRMIEAGVIDEDKFPNFYNEKNLEISSDNSHVVLNTLWAFGLSNKNPILENGPMMDPRYGGAKNFASTAGWTLAKGDAMDHYSMHQFLSLTDKQQALVEKVAKHVFRPCCNNSTYFPDCNHGMAMLGLLEIMAFEGADEAEMYKIAEQVNSYWFSESTETIKIPAGCAA